MNMDVITKPAIVRLARRAGVKSMEGLMYDEIRMHIQNMLNKWIAKIVDYTAYNRKSTIDVNAVTYGIPHKYFSEALINSVCSPKNKKVKKDIEHYQSLSGCLMIPKLPFSRVVKHIAKEYMTNIRLSHDAILLLQHCLENCVVEMLSHANVISSHADRVKVIPKDLQLSTMLRQNGRCDAGGLSVAGPKANFELFISRVQKQLQPDTKMSKNAKSQMNQFVNLILNAISEKCGFLVNKKKKMSTISSRTVMFATRMVLNGELAIYCVNSGTKAVTKFKLAKGQKINARNVRAGLVFPPSRVGSFLKKYKCNVGSTSGIFLAAVVEHIVAEMLELSANETFKMKKMVIDSRAFKLALDADQELSDLAKSLCFDIADGGVTPSMRE